MKVKNAGKNALAITINGKQYQTLSRIAAALNAVESGHTAESVCRDFLMAAPKAMLSKPYDLADFILGDVRFDGERETYITAAFISEGLWGQEAFRLAHN